MAFCLPELELARVKNLSYEKIYKTYKYKIYILNKLERISKKKIENVTQVSWSNDSMQNCKEWKFINHFKISSFSKISLCLLKRTKNTKTFSAHPCFSILVFYNNFHFKYFTILRPYMNFNCCLILDVSRRNKKIK